MALIGDIGGITELVIMIGAAMISKFIEHMANSRLISEIYQVQQYSKETSDLIVEGEQQDDKNTAPPD